MAEKPDPKAAAPAKAPLLTTPPQQLVPPAPKARAVVAGLRPPSAFEQQAAQKLGTARDRINNLLQQIGQALPSIELLLQEAEGSPLIREMAAKFGIDLSQITAFLKMAEALLNQFSPVEG